MARLGGRSTFACQVLVSTKLVDIGGMHAMAAGSMQSTKNPAGITLRAELHQLKTCIQQCNIRPKRQKATCMCPATLLKGPNATHAAYFAGSVSCGWAHDVFQHQQHYKMGAQVWLNYTQTLILTRDWAPSVDNNPVSTALSQWQPLECSLVYSQLHTMSPNHAKMPQLDAA
jgi:hypothetical protein